MLTQIVTETSAKVESETPPPITFMNTGDHPWSPSHHNTNHWSKESQRRAVPQPEHSSFSPRRHSFSDEKSVQGADEEQSYSSSDGRPGSPSEVEKITLTPEDEHKQRQMQDVLQAIGMNLGSEELGQMSHRIRERLYGKKDKDVGCHRRRSRERDTRRALSPKPENRSSSSSSSFSPSPQEYNPKNNSCSAQRDVTEEQPQAPEHEAVEYGQNSSSDILQEQEHYETKSNGSPAACQSFSHNPTYTLSAPSPATVMPKYLPVKRTLLPNPPLLPNPYQVRPGLFLPRMPPFHSFPHAPPFNIFPAVVAPTGHLLAQHTHNPQPLFNLPMPPVNTTQHSKTLSRPRCLQVIKTKQPVMKTTVSGD